MRTRRALVCAPVMPEFDRESGSRRIFHLIELLREAGWSVTFFAENMTGGERYARILRQRGVMVYGGVHSRWISDAYVPNPKGLLEAGEFDLVLVAFWYFAEALLPLVRAAAPEAHFVVDSIDVHFLRQARKLLGRDPAGQPAGTLDHAYASEMVRELNTYAAADGVFTVSQKEADLINDFVAVPDLAHAVPDTEELPPSPVPYEQREGILFVGNFRHRPNVEAVEYLFAEILPRLDPHVLERDPLYVVGNGMDEAISRLGEGWPNVKMVGWVPSVHPYFNRARISIVPLTYGAGTKRKVIETLSIGTPCVSTSIGAEGLALEHGEHLLVADAPEAFATAMARLLGDAALWHRLSRQGRSHIVATHGRGVVGARLEEALRGVMEKRPAAGVAPSSMEWISGALAGRMQRAKVSVKHLLRTVRLRAQLGSGARGEP